MLTIIAIVAALLFPACATEDSTICAWDGSAQGNGQGASFVALSDDLIIYLP